MAEDRRRHGSRRVLRPRDGRAGGDRGRHRPHARRLRGGRRHRLLPAAGDGRRGLARAAASRGGGQRQRRPRAVDRQGRRLPAPRHR